MRFRLTSTSVTLDDLAWTDISFNFRRISRVFADLGGNNSFTDLEPVLN